MEVKVFKSKDTNVSKFVFDWGNKIAEAIIN